MPASAFNNLSQEKQERILQAATKKFGLHNIQEANLANIIKDTGISGGSPYQYFTGRNDLYIYVFDTLRARRVEYVKPAFRLYKKETFLRFFEKLHPLDSVFLLQNPSHIELGKQLYSHSNGVSGGLILQVPTRYRECFLAATEIDKEKILLIKV